MTQPQTVRMGTREFLSLRRAGEQGLVVPRREFSFRFKSPANATPKMAERQGFEPWEPIKVHWFSKPARSAAPSPLRSCSAITYSIPGRFDQDQIVREWCGCRQEWSHTRAPLLDDDFHSAFRETRPEKGAPGGEEGRNRRPCRHLGPQTIECLCGKWRRAGEAPPYGHGKKTEQDNASAVGSTPHSPNGTDGCGPP